MGDGTEREQESKNRKTALWKTGRNSIQQNPLFWRFRPGKSWNFGEKPAARRITKPLLYR